MKGLKINALRFNESSDFHSQDCVNKLDYISCGLLDYDVKTYGYSARLDLDFSNVSFIVRGSGFDCNNGKTVVIDPVDNRSNRFTYQGGETFRLVGKPGSGLLTCNVAGDDFFVCPADCRACSYCQEEQGNIAFINHKSPHRHAILPEKTKGKGKYVPLNLEYNVNIAIGNSKIPGDTAILNMGDALTCPSKKRGLCKVPGDCYARKPERVYPKCLPSRRRAKKYWLSNSARTILSNILVALKLK
jgi:hypothetical protein